MSKASDEVDKQKDELPDLLEAKGGGNMSPVLEVLSMKSSRRFENRLRNVSSRVESPALTEPPSPVLPTNKKEHNLLITFLCDRS